LTNPQVSGYTGRLPNNLLDFSFVYDGKQYKVFAKEGQYHKLGPYYKFIAHIAPKNGLHPADYAHVNDYFDIVPPLPQNPIPKTNVPEQMKLDFGTSPDKDAQLDQMFSPANTLRAATMLRKIAQNLSGEL
jgi:hypothetical protein